VFAELLATKNSFKGNLVTKIKEAATIDTTNSNYPKLIVTSDSEE